MILFLLAINTGNLVIMQTSDCQLGRRNCSVNVFSTIPGICPEPEEMENAVKSVPPQYEVGAKISYTCDQCYTGGGTSTCQCNREWSPVEKCYCK